MKLYPLSDHTAHEFNEELSSWFASSLTTKKHQNELLGILQKYFPKAKIPVKITKGGNAVSTLSEQLCCKQRYAAIDVCLNGCVAYVGEHSNCTKCPVCSACRYTASQVTPMK